METLRGSDLRRIEQYIDALESRKKAEIGIEYGAIVNTERARAEKDAKAHKIFKTILKKHSALQKIIKQVEQDGKFKFRYGEYGDKSRFELGYRWETIALESIHKKKYARLALLETKVCKLKELLIFSDKKKILAEIKKLELV